MKSKRTNRDKEFKFKVAIEAIKGEKQISELAAEFGVHPQQISLWKKELMDNGPELFSSKTESDVRKIEKEREQLYKTIGHQQVRIDWLKKSLGSAVFLEKRIDRTRRTHEHQRAVQVIRGIQIDLLLSTEWRNWKEPGNHETD